MARTLGAVSGTAGETKARKLDGTDPLHRSSQLDYLRWGNEGGIVDSPNGPTGDRDEINSHPDLRALGRRLRLEMDETLRAEQYAARVSAQRRSTIRDRLLLAEDRAEDLIVDVSGGAVTQGVVLAVGADHVVVASRGTQSWIALQHIVALRRPAA